MKAVVSSTYDSKYIFYLPIVTWAWNKLGVDVLCALPQMAQTEKERTRYLMVIDTIGYDNLNFRNYMFDCPLHKEATYTQCSRLYAASISDLPDDETIIISDVDMVVLQKDFILKSEDGFFDIYGIDLVPKGQMPMCYAVGKVDTWRKYFAKGRTYQECLDDELGPLEAEHFRGNFWSRDQELLEKGVGPVYLGHKRTNGQNQFATHRYDRDDAFLLDRLNQDTIDFHMPRPGYEEKNFEIILKVMQYHYPNEDFTWLKNYREEFIKLL